MISTQGTLRQAQGGPSTGSGSRAKSRDEQRRTTRAETGYLVPQDTLAEANGEGAPLELGTLAGKLVLVVLRVTEIIEQESLHVSVWGSADGKDWGSKALFWFPQRFYRGVTPAALDLSQRPEAKFLQARWEVNRFGRGYPVPSFKFSVEVEESGPQQTATS